MSDKLNTLMSDLLRLESSQVTDDLKMRDSDVWDSLKHMELIVSIEDAFCIELESEEIVQMDSVKAIKKILAQKGVQN
ncbi:MAG: acyl carrier protein [Calditrichaeota bacterium]|nr:MAG: acyl carrier protein [Calditrichota bacterium]MBL1204048.1 acyl carrier protein [Calditrichota bacterium]NOG43879.1 acyl carrier protein [Calditrichota bacterium]